MIGGNFDFEKDSLDIEKLINERPKLLRDLESYLKDIHESSGINKEQLLSFFIKLAPLEKEKDSRTGAFIFLDFLKIWKRVFGDHESFFEEEFLKEFPDIIEPVALEREKLSLARELSESEQVFNFNGITEKSYERAKEDEGYLLGEGLDIVLIDDVLEKFKKEGMKVVMRGLDVKVLPATVDVDDLDYIQMIKVLEIYEGMDSRLVRLIELDRL